MNRWAEPPRFAEFVLKLTLPSRYREQQIGDLAEAFFTLRERSSLSEARRWFWRQVLKSILPNLKLSLRRDARPQRQSPTKTFVLGGALVEDLRFASRTLRRRPLFTAVAVLTVGLGIGGTTAIFSVVEGVLLRPLPYAQPTDLVTVLETFPEWRTDASLAQGWDRVTLDYPNFERWRLNQSSFQDVAAFGSTPMVLTGLGEPELIPVGTASTSLLNVLGVRLHLGRPFLPNEDGREASAVAIISHECWQNRFAEDPGVLEKTITLDGRNFQIVGVLPRSFYLRRLGYGADPNASGMPLVWIPIGIVDGSLRAGNHLYDGIARLESGVSIAQALTQTARLVRGDLDPSERGARLISADERRDMEIGPFRAPLLLLLGASLVLLLIASGNVAMLSLAEVSGRRVEMLTRTALGARPSRLARQLLTESVLLGVLGSAVGILLTLAVSRLLLSMAPPFPWSHDVRLNGLVLSFAITAGVVTGLLFGLAPSFGLSRHGLQERPSRAATGTGRPGQDRLQRLMVSLEIALTVVLLVCGGLLGRSMVSLFAVDPGFRLDNLAEVRVRLSRDRFGDAETRNSAFLEIQDAIAAVPGVSRASGTSGLPFSGSGWMSDLEVEGREAETVPHAHFRLVLPGFFDVLGIPLVSGRVLVDADHSAETGWPVVISETMARQFWPRGSAVGGRVRLGDGWHVVVGIVGDVRHESLNSEYLPTIYVPVRSATASLVVRTAVDPQHLYAQIREAVWSVDPSIPILNMRTVRSLMSETAAHERFRTVLLVTFAMVAVLLGTVGVFGVTARSVSRRTRELGIRLALGAQGARLTRMVVRRTLSAGIVGIGLGLPVALVTSTLLTPFLFGVERWDPLTYGAVVLLMLGVCWLASYLPARRTSTLDPAKVLRVE